MRCLPTQSKIIVQTQLHSLSNQLGRSATAAELSAALNIYRHHIEIDIYLHGSTMNPDNQGHDKDIKPTKSWPEGPIYSVNYAKDAPKGTGNGDARINGRTEDTLTRTVTK